MALHMFDSLSAIFGDTSEAGDATQYGSDVETTPNRRRSLAAPAGSPQDNDRHRNVDSEAEREDLLDQHVAYYLKHHPEVHSKHDISRIRPGLYSCDDREIAVEWHYSEDPNQQGYLIAVDGPLRQPFADYMQGNERGTYYDDKRLGVSALQQIPKGKRISFGDGNKMYSRLEAMKVAKEQALVRERAADFVKGGMMVPQHELMEKYRKTISQKLGEQRQREPEPGQLAQTQPQVARPAQVAEAPVATPVSNPASALPATSGNTKQKLTHGAPKYCANHDSTEKRKKCKSQDLPCSICQTVIQTNYQEFSICPTCSEKDHRCMCCGAPAAGAGPSPQAPSSPMSKRPSAHAQSKPPSQQPSQMSPMNLFGNMANLLDASKAGLQSSTGGLSKGGAITSAWQGFSQNRPTSTIIMASQNNAFASSNVLASSSAVVSHNPVTSQNHYASQAAFACSSPMASQNVIMSRR